jgi:uncharacterized protein (DUF983 family)
MDGALKPQAAQGWGIMLAPVLRGLRLKCPACGEGRMSARWWTLGHLRDECPRCGVRFEPARGECARRVAY